MKILNNYDEMILSIESNDTNRFENLLGYSDCRDNLIFKYADNFGVEGIYKVSKNLKATALKRVIFNLLSHYTETSR